VKQIFAVLLISFGVYSFAFGLFISARSLEMERMEQLKNIVYPEDPPPTAIKASPIERYPLGLFLLSASGTTFGIWGGIHLLVQRQPAKNRKKKA
jgi:hypothetical protein